MSKAALHTAAILASFPARFPAQPGTVNDLAASGVATDLQAAGVKDYSTLGELKYVRANEHFFAQGSLIQADDIVQLPKDEAKRLLDSGRAVEATDEEVAAAKAPAKGAK